MQIWWWNQSRDWRLERRAGVVCASEHMANITYRKMVGDVRHEDIILHDCRPHIIAASRVQEHGQHYPPLPLVGGEAYVSGWRCASEYYDLSTPLPRMLSWPGYRGTEVKRNTHGTRSLPHAAL